MKKTAQKRTKKEEREKIGEFIYQYVSSVLVLED